ncbi:hypothetical protein EV175_003735 [Coemansia sp. RSA 1933]|nr:hypothetical protein EV175_003735 [Coemansia sp. RSA 1933]
MKLEIHAIVVVFAAMVGALANTTPKLSSPSATSPALRPSSQTVEEDVHVGATECTMTLPFGATLIASQLPFSLSLPLWGKVWATSTTHKDASLAPPLPRYEWSETSELSVCDSSNGEFAPSGCVQPSSVNELLARRKISDPLATDRVTYRADEQEPWAEQEPESEPELGYLDNTHLWTIVFEQEEPRVWPSGGHTQSAAVQPPEMHTPAAAAAEAAAAEGGYSECETGAMRCDADGQRFDTCVHGRWGTLRRCSQGTWCSPVGRDSIVCG